MPVKDLKTLGMSVSWFLAMLICFSIMSVQAQEMSVLSFQRLEKDMDARVSYPVKDRDGELAALIKVVTTETGFEFDGGLLGLIKVERKTGEYWVYVPRGAAAITIKHDRLGVLRDYAYPLPIEKATVYEMKLVTGRLRVEVEPIELQSEYLVITTEPGDALIYIDDLYEAKGLLQKKLIPGSYTYRVEAPLYHTEAGRITVRAGQKEEKQVTLKPNHGFIEVITTPEAGAKVLIDDMDAGFQTNGTTTRLRSGEYTVTVIREQYQPSSQRVTVRDGETTRVNLAMTPNFAVVEVKIPSEASLYINNQHKGEGNWKGRLGTGVYSLEARQPRHKPGKKDIQVVLGQDQTISLTPEPIYGSLDITSVPARASIKLDGKDQGTTPMIIRNLLVGEYTLRLSAAGHGTYTERVEVKEGPPMSVHAVLPSGMELSIESDPPGARVEIDGNEAGITPLKVLMAYGSHNLKITNKSKVVSETVTVSEGGKATYRFDVRETRDFTEQAMNLGLEMVFVEGGSFTMGCTKEQGKDCENDEKPSHRVTLGDYYIGKYEVTQRQWQAVMGNNPSYNKGCDDCPVENVSWDDVQEFIRKLNQLTRKQYRLPTEAEWEYAARGGNQGKAYRYSGSNTLVNVGWYTDNSGSKTRVVGSKQANELGLYDMSGNVWEWCSDWYGAYTGSDKVNPGGPSTGTYRVLRGGSWNLHQQNCRVSFRGSISPQYRRNRYGFRLVLAS